MIITSIGIQQKAEIQSPSQVETGRYDIEHRNPPEDILNLGNDTGIAVYDRNGMVSRKPEEDLNESKDEKDISDDQELSDDSEYSESEKKKIQELEKTDREVRAHENAHMAAGAGLVRGSASYEYRKGPDGKLYAVGGEVSIDTSDEPNPRDTVRKMQRVKAAAMAPADPSPQDRRIAMKAALKAAMAQVKVTEQRSLEAEQTRHQETDKNARQNKGIQSYLKTAQKNLLDPSISTRA